MTDKKHPDIPADSMDLFNFDGNPEVGSYEDDKKTGECNKYIYKLIPESKAEIDKLVKSGIY